MAANPLSSLRDYSSFVAQFLNRSTVERSTVRVWSDGSFTGIAEGEIFFSNGMRLRIREELDFEATLITSYGYEVYRHEERLYWYDDFPHPNDKTLAPSFPHHEHIPPDLKHNRIPTPEIGFSHANLPFLIKEGEDLIENIG